MLNTKQKKYDITTDSTTL